MRQFKFAAYAAAVCVGLASVSMGATIAYTDAGVSLGPTTTSLNIGREFSVAAGGITVSDLGVYDANSDGLIDSHDVTLFSITGSGANPPAVFITTVNVPSGTAATLDSGFRFAAITPVFLPAGNYAVIAYGLGNDVFGDGGGLPSAPVAHLGFDPFQFISDPSPAFPNGGDGGSHSGASFLYSVPEPASLGLLAIGGLALLARRRRA